MNAHVIILPGKCERYATSTAEARQYRELMMQEFGVKKKEITIQPINIPTQKVDLLEFINNLLTRIEQ